MRYIKQARKRIVLIGCLNGVWLIGMSAVAPFPSEAIQTSGAGIASSSPSRPAAAAPNQSKKEEVEQNRQPAPQGSTARAWKILEGGLAEKDLPKRTEAISALAIVGRNPKAVSLLETALADKEPAVRQTAVVALGAMKSRRSVPKLRKMLQDDAPEVNFAAAQTLWHMGDSSGRGILLEVLAGERKSSGGGLGRKIGEAKEKLHHPSALAKIGIRQGASALLGPFAIGLKVAEELRKDSSGSGRAVSAALLATDKNPESAEQLEQALDDKDWLVRSAAAKALAKRRYRHALPRLEALLNDDEDVVRYSAAGAILALK